MLSFLFCVEELQAIDKEQKKRKHVTSREERYKLYDIIEIFLLSTTIQRERK